jgi:hypothetical protein
LHIRAGEHRSHVPILSCLVCATVRAGKSMMVYLPFWRDIRVTKKAQDNGGAAPKRFDLWIQSIL